LDDRHEPSAIVVRAVHALQAPTGGR